MAFSYLAGVTLAAAPDEIVDWFATFEAWMIGIGWTVVAGAGTTDVVFNSVGEAGPPLTMLFIHVWRDVGNPNRVRVEVSDDAIPTHETTRGGYVDGAGAQFAFSMCGDMDAINIVFQGGAFYRTIYAGLVVPFALTVPDETYSMIVTNNFLTGTILRNHDGTWDVDDQTFDNNRMDDARRDDYDGTLALGGIYFNRDVEIAGQLKHVSALVTDPGVTVCDTLTTGRPGATSTWIVLRDHSGNRFAMRTGGVLPAGPADPGTFAAVSGVAANLLALWTALTNHLTGRGWVSLGDPGYQDEGRLYSSVGESGVEEIYIGYAWSVLGNLYPYVQDDAVGTHRYPFSWHYLTLLDFPLNYWICGDKDCCILVFQRAGGYTVIWSGLVPAFVPGLIPPYPGPCLSPYQVFVNSSGEPFGAMSGLLRGHDGGWGPAASMSYDSVYVENSNPNAFDGTTYLIWPWLAYGLVGSSILGELRYMGFSSGGGIASMDTITIAGEVFTVFFTYDGHMRCVRTV